MQVHLYLHFQNFLHTYGGAARYGKRVHTRGEEIIEKFSVHNHALSAAEIEVLRARSSIRKRAIDSRDPPILFYFTLFILT